MDAYDEPMDAASSGHRTIPDYKDIDEDRRPESRPPRGRSYSRSPSTTPVPGRRDRSPTRRADSRSRSRSRSRSPLPHRRSRSPAARRYDRDDRDRRDRNRSRSPPPPRSDRRRSPPPKPRGAPAHVDPTTVLGVFGLSIRTVEADLKDEFEAIAPVDKVVVVYDARSGRSRGFGFVTMRDVDGASAAIEALNGKDLHGRKIRVDFSTTHKPHDPTPGIYKGEIRPDDRYRAPARGGDRSSGGGRDGGSRYTGRAYDRADRAGPSSYRGGDSYRRGFADSRDDWRRRPSPPRRPRRSPSPPPKRSGGSRYSRSPSPRRGGGDRYDADREERVPPPSRARLGSHLDSPPREDNVEPSRYY